MKVACVFHRVDLDGWMSGAIVMKWFKETLEVKPKVSKKRKFDNHVEELPLLHMIGWSYGDEIPDLKEFDKVIMCDISFPSNEMLKLFYNLHEDQFIWIDHHNSSILDSEKSDYCNTAGLRDKKFAACELTWMHFFPDVEMPEIVRLLGMYDSFRHKGTEEERKVLVFQYAARAKMSGYEECYKTLETIQDEHIEGWLNVGEGIYSYLCTEAKSVLKNAFMLELDEGDVKRKVACINKERFNPINFGIQYHEDGYDAFACFHYNGHNWAFSIYNDNGEVDCSLIAKSLGGGGHKGASGFIVPDINDFLKKYKR